MNPRIERRVVVVDEGERSRVIADGPSSEVITDPARPGFCSALLWVTDSSPVRLKDVREALGHGQSSLLPPPGGSLCRVVTFPPEKGYLGQVSAAQVQAYFDRAGAPAVSTYGAGAPHPYMQKSRTLDFCFVIEGRITLVLDTEEVHLEAGDIVVQRGTNHAWSNRGDARCVMVFSAHDAFV